MRRPFWCRCVQAICACAVTASIAAVYDEATKLNTVKIDPKLVVIPVSGSASISPGFTFTLATGSQPAKLPPREELLKRSGTKLPAPTKPTDTETG